MTRFWKEDHHCKIIWLLSKRKRIFFVTTVLNRLESESPPQTTGSVYSCATKCIQCMITEILPLGMQCYKICGQRSIDFCFGMDKEQQSCSVHQVLCGSTFWKGIELFCIFGVKQWTPPFAKSEDFFISFWGGWIVPSLLFLLQLLSWFVSWQNWWSLWVEDVAACFSKRFRVENDKTLPPTTFPECNFWIVMPSQKPLLIIIEPFWTQSKGTFAPGRKNWALLSPLEIR